MIGASVPALRRARPLLREAGKVARRAGWGAESRDGLTKVGNDARAIRPKLLLWPTPHPALRATFPSGAGEGKRLGVEP
jgi:hypothetical protein